MCVRIISIKKFKFFGFMCEKHKILSRRIFIFVNQACVEYSQRLRMYATNLHINSGLLVGLVSFVCFSLIHKVLESVILLQSIARIWLRLRVSVRLILLTLVLYHSYYNETVRLIGFGFLIARSLLIARNGTNKRMKVRKIFPNNSNSSQDNHSESLPSVIGVYLTQIRKIFECIVSLNPRTQIAKLDGKAFEPSVWNTEGDFEIRKMSQSIPLNANVSRTNTPIDRIAPLRVSFHESTFDNKSQESRPGKNRDYDKPSIQSLHQPIEVPTRYTFSYLNEPASVRNHGNHDNHHFEQYGDKTSAAAEPGPSIEFDEHGRIVIGSTKQVRAIVFCTSTVRFCSIYIEIEAQARRRRVNLPRRPVDHRGQTETKSTQEYYRNKLVEYAHHFTLTHRVICRRQYRSVGRQGSEQSSAQDTRDDVCCSTNLASFFVSSSFSIGIILGCCSNVDDEVA